MPVLKRVDKHIALCSPNSGSHAFWQILKKPGFSFGGVFLGFFGGFFPPSPCAIFSSGDKILWSHSSYADLHTRPHMAQLCGGLVASA